MLKNGRTSLEVTDWRVSYLALSLHPSQVQGSPAAAVTHGRVTTHRLTKCTVHSVGKGIEMTLET